MRAYKFVDYLLCEQREFPLRGENFAVGAREMNYFAHCNSYLLTCVCVVECRGMANALLSVRGLRRAFGEVQAVRDVSFELERGQVVGLIGANGAGKTTTMRILVGMDLQDEGCIWYDGVDATAEPWRLRGRIGWMPDAFNPPPHTAVWEYVDFYARAFGLKGAARWAEVQRVLGFCGLGEMQERMVDRLSKGEQQRVNLARMLVGDPELVVMDEPAAGLDPRARLKFKHCVRELVRQGKTLLISSHIISELAEMCDSFILMDKGQVLRHEGCEEMRAAGTAQRLVYEFRLAGAGAGALQQALEALPEWEQVELLAPDAVRAVYAGEPGEPLALQLRTLAAEHLLVQAACKQVSLEETVIDLMNGHE